MKQILSHSTNTYRKFRIITAFFIFTATLLVVGNAKAVRDYLQKDYMVDQSERFHGAAPVVSIGHTISHSDSRWAQSVTFSMQKTHSLLVRVDPISETAGVIMSASSAASPRLVKALWAHDDMHESVTLWTNHYWIPIGDCNATGCPRIRFTATKGTVGITILEKKVTYKAYIK